MKTVTSIKKEANKVYVTDMQMAKVSNYKYLITNS